MPMRSPKTPEDQNTIIGLGPYVAAFCDFLRRQNQTCDPARTISIEGGWGSGKSTFVEQTIKRLRAQNVPVVEFKPWLHHNVDELWIALAEAVHRDIRGQLTRPQYTWRMLVLRLKRLFRWGHTTHRRHRLTRWFIVLLLLVVLGVIGGIKHFGGSISEVVLELPAFAKTLTLGVTSVVAGITVVLKLLPLLGHRSTTPKPSQKPPLVHQLEHEFADLINALCPKGEWTRRAVIFVDDLDRCSAIGVSETFRALSALVNERINATIVLAIDRDRVAAALAADDKRLTPFHVTNGASGSDEDERERAVRLGHAFLEKFINVTMRIPATGLNQIPRMLRGEDPDPYLERSDLAERSETADEDARLAIGRLDKEFVFLANDYLHGNPRRIWLWRREIELRVLTLSHLGRYDRSIEPTSDCVSVEQLARFELLTILWPRFIGDLKRHLSLVKWLSAYEIAAGQEVALPPRWNVPPLAPGDPGWGCFEYWATRHGEEALAGLLSREDSETLTSTSQPPVMVRMDPALLLIMQDVHAGPCRGADQKPPVHSADASETPPDSPAADEPPEDAPPPGLAAEPDDADAAEAESDTQPAEPVAPVAADEDEPVDAAAPVADEGAKFYDSELRAARAAVERARQSSGTDSARYADALSRLEHVLANLGRFAESERHASRVLEIRRRLYEGDHPDVATSLNNLAMTVKDLGRAEEAEPIYREALDMTRRLYEGDHPDVAYSLSNLASVTQDLGRAEEAEPIHQHALDMRRRLYEGDHPDVATSLNNLASVRSALGRAEEAEPLYQQALDMRRRLYEGDHPDVATSLSNLASVAQNLGRAEEAEPIYREALDMRRRLYEGDHPDVARSLNNLAAVRVSLGRMREALELATEAAEMARRCLPVGHPNRELYEENLAWLQKQLESDNGPD